MGMGKVRGDGGKRRWGDVGVWWGYVSWVVSVAETVQTGEPTLGHRVDNHSPT